MKIFFSILYSNIVPLSLFLFNFVYMQSKNNKRPMSPHLQIYKLPLVSVLSITHRFTGVFLFFFFFLLIWLFSINVIFPELNLINYLGIKTTPFPFLCCILYLAFDISMIYHLCNGIRHMLWDIGLFLSLKAVRVTNYIVLVSTAIITLLIFITQLLLFKYVVV